MGAVKGLNNKHLLQFDQIKMKRFNTCFHHVIIRELSVTYVKCAAALNEYMCTYRHLAAVMLSAVTPAKFPRSEFETTFFLLRVVFSFMKRFFYFCGK